MADDVRIRSQFDGLEFINYEDTKTLTPSNCLPIQFPPPIFPSDFIGTLLSDLWPAAAGSSYHCYGELCAGTNRAGASE